MLGIRIRRGGSLNGRGGGRSKLALVLNLKHPLLKSPHET